MAGPSLGSLGASALLLLGAAVPGSSQSKAPGTLDWEDAGTCYEIFVRSFYDSDGDGVGDLRGLIEKLDYLNDGDPASGRDLGVDCIWLMPIAVSPSYHGYDVTDYYRVDRRYGSNEDFRELMRRAHARGIRGVLGMVVNHVSSEHPYFKDALQHRGSRYRDWFRWSDAPGPPNEWGGNNWHRSPFAEEYYYGFFSPSMPDLDWESPAVRREMMDVSTFWLREMGADGFRLDAVRHLMENADGTSANVPRTHDMLRDYQAHIRRVAPGAHTIGEVFDSTDVLLAYYPDQLDAYFAFQVANAILDAVRTGSPHGLTRAVMELQARVPAHRWSPFLRNHDQTRTMTELAGDVARAKLAASLLLTMPGLPFVYYGEEIGMTGDKPDPRIRTPMQWTVARSAGFTSGIPWEPLQPDSFTANVEVMDGDPTSLLSHYRRLIHLRAEDAALRLGGFTPLETDRPQVLAYLRRSGEDATLVVANLGSTAVMGVSLTSEDGALPEGIYAPSEILAGVEVGQVVVGDDGRLRRYTPLRSLSPRTAYVLRMTGSSPDPTERPGDRHERQIEFR